MSENQLYYERTWFVVLMLIVFFPVGLILMWKGNKFGKISRVIISIAGLSLLHPTVMRKSKQLLFLDGEIE